MTAWMSNAMKRRKARADGGQALCDWIAGRKPARPYYEFRNGRRVYFGPYSGEPMHSADPNGAMVQEVSHRKR